MRWQGVRSRNVPASVRISAAVCGATCVGGLLLGGCAPARKKAAFPWQTATIVRPIVPEPEAGSAEQPDVQGEAPAMDSGVALIVSSPARPHVAPPARTPEEPAKPALPTISPQLSAEEAQAAQQDTNASLSAADRNLESTRGKTLNANQADILSKIRGFMSDARDAAHSGDWTRARNLAKKAQVLSEELAKSL